MTLGSLASFLNTPLAIAGKPISSRLVLAPMAQLGHAPFRELLSRFGGVGLMFSEMCEAKRIIHENRKVSPYFRWRDEEAGGLVWQIFGSDPRVMADAARRIESEGFFGVDINFGCCAGAVCGREGGAAVLKDPVLAVHIVEAIRKAVNVPVFVKFRTGWEDDPSFPVEMARRFEEAGADALTFHPRVAPDRRAQRPKWEYIGLVKAAVRIPVFGNGDVFDAEDCLRMITQTGCDGVAVGRMAAARPWLFAQWTGRLPEGEASFLETALTLARLLFEAYDPKNALRRFRRFSLYFSANFLFGHTLHSRLMHAEDPAAVEEVLEDFFKSSPERNPRPNMNLFR